jgi:hypothetical protein
LFGYPAGVRLLRRRSAEEPPGDGPDTTGSEPRAVRGHATPPGKGRPTPRRAEAQRRRTGPVPPPPRTRKEAARRQRELGGRSRVSAREALRSGDESAMPRRDRGPERAMVRNVVDSRRNASSLFLWAAVLVLLSYAVPSPAVKNFVFSVWIAVFGLIVVDAVVLGIRISKLKKERFPQYKRPTAGLVAYGMNRTILPRRWRLPAPLVKTGDPV